MICIIYKEVAVIYLIIVIFLLVCGGLAVLTVFDITTQVHLTVMSWQSPDLPIGIWLLIAFFLGSVLFYLIQVVEAWGDRSELKRLRERIDTLEKELGEAKTASSSANSAMGTPGIAGAQAMPMAMPSSPMVPNPMASSPRIPNPMPSSSKIPNPMRPPTSSPYHKKSLMPMPGNPQQQQQQGPHQDSPPHNFRQ
jgi:uncharacterized integral membrane protein